LNFIPFCHTLTKLDDLAAIAIQDCLKHKVVAKGDYLLKHGEICRYFFFIEKGLVKTCFTNGDKEFIMRFFNEGSICTQLESYITQTPSLYAIIALEETTITYIDYKLFEQLCAQHHAAETLYRKFVSMASINMMRRISEMLEENATARYANFVNENKHLLQRISLGDLAAYIGITQVSLSRIRAKK
jgi:CRP-like cAMP-binding protein